ncbi:MAG: MBL fold metallo-hydrolase [Nitrososphaerota archaeon]
MQEIAKEIFYLGTVGKPATTAIYAIYDGEECTIIEPGPNSGAAMIVKWLSDAGIEQRKVKRIIATHIHLDHAGASAALLKAYPDSRLIVYKGAAKHLIDPSQLISSASSILGPFFEIWGGMPAVDAGRIVETGDNANIESNGKSLSIIYTPGHAAYHMSIWEANARVLFTGDAVGMYTKQRDTLWPASPLPSFRLDMEMNTLQKISQLDAKVLAIPHYAPVYNAKEFFDLNIDIYQKWHSILSSLKGEKDTELVASKLADAIDSYSWVKNDSMTWLTFKMHVAGFLNYESSHASF